MFGEVEEDIVSDSFLGHSSWVCFIMLSMVNVDLLETCKQAMLWSWSVLFWARLLEIHGSLAFECLCFSIVLVRCFGLGLFLFWAYLLGIQMSLAFECLCFSIILVLGSYVSCEQRV